MNSLLKVPCDQYNRLKLINQIIKQCYAETTKTRTDTTPPLPPAFPSLINEKEAECVPVPPEKTLSGINILVPSSSTKLNIKISTPSDLVPESDVNKAILSFDNVPGPILLRRIAKFWSVIPIIGTQVTASTIQYMLSAGKIFGNQLTWGNNVWLFRRLLDEYGPVVRLHGPFGGNVVIISRPEHACAVFQNEGRFPIRSSLDCLEKYRLEYRKYKQAGPFLMYGPEWEKLRQSIEKPLQESVTKQFDKLDRTSDELIARIYKIRNRQEEVPETFGNEIYKWGMECLCSVTLDKRLGFLDPIGVSTTSEPARLLDSLLKATESIRKCENGLHIWKFVETPAWNNLVSSCDTIDDIFGRYIRKAQESLSQKKTDTELDTTSVSLLENLLIKDGMAPEDVLTVILDMMLVGVNAISHCVAFLLYHLARYPRVQKKLYEEIFADEWTPGPDKLMGMSYLQACIKESLRLKPPIPILSRVLPKDAVVHNYRIPKGTFILIASHLSSLREEYFEDPERFHPERWLGSEFTKETQGFASLPFGYGPRACLAKELSEMQISLLMAKILRRFRIEYHYGELKSTNRLLARPNRPLRFTFIDRV